MSDLYKIDDKQRGLAERKQPIRARHTASAGVPRSDRRPIKSDSFAVPGNRLPSQVTEALKPGHRLLVQSHFEPSKPGGSVVRGFNQYSVYGPDDTLVMEHHEPTADEIEPTPISPGSPRPAERSVDPVARGVLHPPRRKRPRRRKKEPPPIQLPPIRLGYDPVVLQGICVELRKDYLFSEARLADARRAYARAERFAEGEAEIHRQMVKQGAGKDREHAFAVAGQTVSRARAGLLLEEARIGLEVAEREFETARSALDKFEADYEGLIDPLPRRRGD